MVVAVLADDAGQQAGGGRVVAEGFLDDGHEVRHFERFRVADHAGQGDAGRGDFSGEAAVDVRVGEDL